MCKPTEPQQDRNVEARASELLPCPFCPPELSKPEHTVRYSYISGKLCSIRCLRCNAQSGEFHTETEAISAWNSRPSQPPQNVEARDAVKGVMEEIESLKKEEVWNRDRTTKHDIPILSPVPSKIRELLFSDRLRLALSATGDDARGRDQELQRLRDELNEIFEMCQKTGMAATAAPDSMTRCSAVRIVHRLIEHRRIDAERLKAAKGLLREALLMIHPNVAKPYSIREQLEMCQKIDAFLPAQTPGDERQG